MIKRLTNKEFRDSFVTSHISQDLAYQIRELRIQRKLTQIELAQKLGLKGQPAIARMEDPSYGKLSIATLLKLSSVFDVALSIRFQSYGKFLTEREDLSPTALRVKSFNDEMPMILESMNRISNYIPSKSEPSSPLANSYKEIIIKSHPSIIEPSYINNLVHSNHLNKYHQCKIEQSTH